MEERVLKITWNEIFNCYHVNLGIIFNNKWIFNVEKNNFFGQDHFRNKWRLVMSTGPIVSVGYIVKVRIQGIDRELQQMSFSFDQRHIKGDTFNATQRRYIQGDTFNATQSDFPITIYFKFLNNEFEICQLSELSQDFQTLLLEEHLSDVTIRCESAAFKVHKIVLCARSPVFKAMFASPMQENATDAVNLDNVDRETVRSMIQFMYGGKIRIISMSKARSLLDIAEQYQIKSLKDGLIGYFKRNLSEQNAVKIFEMADLYDNVLKKYVIKFISDHFNTMKHATEWEDLKLSKPQLVLEVYSYKDKLH